MRKFCWSGIHVIVAFAVLVARGIPSAGADEDTPRAVDATFAKYLRLDRDEAKKPTALKTAIVRCAASEGQRPLTVDLVAALHVADKGYYERLNREFRRYDAVLYELVAPEGSRAPRRNQAVGNHPVSLLQNGMTDVLALEYQLRHIDYTAKNMVHADMSSEQIAKSMQEHGETALGIMARVMGYALTHQDASRDSSADMLAALFAKNRSLALKRILAEEFDGSDDTVAAIEGSGGLTLLSGRNKAALEVLRRQIAAGRRKLAIFYGAAHMADFQRRLHDDFGLTPVNVRWLVAWNLQSPRN